MAEEMKFKVGDRVRVYDSDRLQFTARLELEDPQTGRWRVRDGDWFGWVHTKQCRRLVKKERRRVWIDKYDYTSADMKVHSLICWSNPHDPDYVEFIEVRKK